jgi:hypothetical protein
VRANLARHPPPASLVSLSQASKGAQRSFAAQLEGRAVEVFSARIGTAATLQDLHSLLEAPGASPSKSLFCLAQPVQDTLLTPAATKLAQTLEQSAFVSGDEHRDTVSSFALMPAGQLRNLALTIAANNLPKTASSPVTQRC